MIGQITSGHEALIAYTTAAEDVYDALHEVSTRFAGLLMSVEMLKTRKALDIESLVRANQRLDDARDGHRRLSAPPAAAHFHHHLTSALVKLGYAQQAIEGKMAGQMTADDPLSPLRAAWKDMQAASRALPGFEVVDFGQSCCAAHTMMPF